MKETIQDMCFGVPVGLGKKYKGKFHDWFLRDYADGQIIVGLFIGHPQFGGKHGYSSMIKNITERDNHFVVESLNSVYLLPKDKKHVDQRKDDPEAKTRGGSSPCHG